MVTHSMENILSMQQYYAPVSSDEALHSPPSKKKRCLAKEQDPMSHRIIEKRRRDRMNNCLADLSRLIPAEYLKKGRGRVEKTEIIEMAIRHMKHLQSLRPDSKHHTTSVSSVHSVHAEDSVDSVSHPSPPSVTNGSPVEIYRQGFHECLGEMMNYLVEVEGFYARDNLCVQLVSHLQQYCDKVIATSDRLGFPHPMELPTMNGVGAFGHTANGIPSTCPGTNGIHLSNNNNNSTTTNGNLQHNVNNNNNNNSNGINPMHQHQPHHHHNHHSLLHNNNNSSNSDRCSSSGVSSYDSTESRATTRSSHLIPPPNLVSDDSNHSSHSHGSSSLTVSTSTTMSNASSHHHHHHHHQESSRPSTNYKFKNSIKQRFSADQRIKTSSSPPPPTLDSSPKHNVQQQTVPIFALHDNGGFYIPLTVEASLLRPHMAVTSQGDFGQDMVLHPVTISVNFNHSSPASSSSWSHPSPTHQIQQ